MWLLRSESREASLWRWHWDETWKVRQKQSQVYRNKITGRGKSRHKNLDQRGPGGLWVMDKRAGVDWSRGEHSGQPHHSGWSETSSQIWYGAGAVARSLGFTLDAKTSQINWVMPVTAHTDCWVNNARVKGVQKQVPRAGQKGNRGYLGEPRQRACQEWQREGSGPRVHFGTNRKWRWAVWEFKRTLSICIEWEGEMQEDWGIPQSS